MYKPSYVVAAACLCASAGLFVAPLIGAEPENMSGQTSSVENSSSLQFPAGIQDKQMDEKDSIQNAFESVTESAFNKKGFPDVIDILCDQDRTRVQHQRPSNHDQSNDPLAQKMGQLRQAWKDKYNQDFDIKNAKVYDNYIHFRTGEISDPSQLVGKWPLPATSMQTSMGGEASGQDVNDAKNHAFGGDVNLDKGRDVAVANLPGAFDGPALTTSMIHEAGGWKFDVPNTITRQQLHQALLNNLSYLYDHKDQWPSDTKQAYRDATYCVVAAMYNVQVGQNASAQNGSNMAPTANNR